MKASFLFNILGTIELQLNLLPYKKTKVLSYCLKLKIANILWEQVLMIRQR